MKRISPIELCRWTTGLNSARNGIVVETPVTTRPSPVGATSPGSVENMPPLRGLRFFLRRAATKISLLTEFGFGAVLGSEVAS